jgi:murein DD-endopeptidase MepM/ murein hydrolase activator NlpD
MENGYIWSPNWHWAGGYGLYLRGDSGDIYYYAHMNGYAPGIVDGTRVGVAQVVGYLGNTGNSSIPHLHLGYQPGGGPLTNPYQLLVKLCR